MRWLVATPLVLVPSTSRTEVCDKLRPSWDPDAGATTTIQEAIILFSVGQPLAIFVRTRWLLNPSFVLTTLLAVAVLSNHINDTYGFVAAGVLEGCIGNPILFIGLCAAICILTLYLAFRPRGRPSSGENEC